MIKLTEIEKQTVLFHTNRTYHFYCGDGENADTTIVEYKKLAKKLIEEYNMLEGDRVFISHSYGNEGHGVLFYVLNMINRANATKELKPILIERF